jgi:hypothetical protein
MLPPIEGRPIRVVLRRTLGPHLGATSIPHRTIYLAREVLAERGEFERILVHELFHFAWVRLSNQTRWDWERLLAEEFRRGTPGELGWSAELRKQKLTARDRRQRSLKWRHYACESFCDTGAYLHAGLDRHEEFTLPLSAIRRRRAWMARNLATRGMRL